MKYASHRYRKYLTTENENFLCYSNMCYMSFVKKAGEGFGQFQYYIMKGLLVD